MSDLSNSAPGGKPAVASMTPNQLIRMARRLPSDGNDRSEGIRSICAHAGALPKLEQDLVLKELKERTGIGIGTLRSEMRHYATRSGEPDHLEFARETLATIGNDSLLFADGTFWQWTGSVWKKRKPEAIRHFAQRTIAAQGYAVTAAKVASVTDVLRNEIYQPDHVFNRGARNVANCLNCELEWGATNGHGNTIDANYTTRPKCRSGTIQRQQRRNFSHSYKMCFAMILTAT